VPLRNFIALALVAVLAALIVWAVVLLARSRPKSAIIRASLIGSIVVLIAMVLWIVFILPIYWD
jgi:hypothetical protein